MIFQKTIIHNCLLLSARGVYTYTNDDKDSGLNKGAICCKCF